jgi:NAD-dependent epimerase/dehydratase family protein
VQLDALPDLRALRAYDAHIFDAYQLPLVQELPSLEHVVFDGFPKEAEKTIEKRLAGVESLIQIDDLAPRACTQSRPPSGNSRTLGGKEKRAMRILVIGGTRFIGAHVVRRLYDAGADVVVFHRGTSSNPILPKVEHVLDPSAEYPVTDFPDRVRGDWDVVIHMVAMGHADRGRGPSV